MATDIALFDILLSTERSTDERLKALYDLRPFLESAEGITKLSEATRAEESKEVKLAMLQMLCEIDISKITIHQPYIDTLATIACLDPERDLRYMAVSRLSLLAAHNNDVQEILALTLLHDMDTDVQLASIQGISLAVYKTEPTIEALYAYLPVAPYTCKRALLALVQQLLHPHSAQMLLHFLHPLEQESLRLEAVKSLAAMPFLLPEVLEAITDALGKETYVPVRDAIIKLLAGLQWIDTALFTHILAALQKMPDQPELLTLVATRLTANPGLLDDFLQLFSTTTSATLKINLLLMLQNADMPQLIIKGLEDTNPYVREAALPVLSNKFAQWQSILEPALVKAISEEKLTALRGGMVNVILQTGRKSEQTENVLVQLAVAEKDHQLKTHMIYAVCQVVATAGNRHSLLQLFSDVLEGAWYAEDLKAYVMSRLQTFMYIDDPALKKSLELMLEQAKDVYELERIYNVLKTMETDFAQLAPTLLRVLYRHIAWYPQQPLHDWVQMIGKLADQHAELRAALPYMVSVTGANWLLKNADKSDQTGAFLPTFKNAMLNDAGTASFMGMKNLITDAWNNRTIKKSEISELYKILLRMPKSVGLIQLVLGLMQQGKLVTPELVQVSLDYILTAQDRNGIWEVRKYLEQTGFMDLTYRQRIISLFTQETYNRYMLYNVPDIHSKKRIKTLNEWEYNGWTCSYSQWPIAQLIFAIEPGDLITRIFSEPVTGEDPSCTLQYLVLEHLFRNSGGIWAKQIFKDVVAFENFLLMLANGYQQLPAGNPLRDRMLYFFWKKWNDYVNLKNGTPIPVALTDVATLVYAGVCEVLKQITPDFNGKQYPDVLKNMNKDLLQQHWPFSAELWDAFSFKYFPVKDPNQDAAVALFQRAAKSLQSGNTEEGTQLLKELLEHYPNTRLVKEKLSVINDTLKQLEAN